LFGLALHIDNIEAPMKYRRLIALVITALPLVCARGLFAAQSGTESAPLEHKALSYPLTPGDREVLMKRIAKLEKGMTVKEALAALQPMRGFPKPVNDVPGNNSFTQDLGQGWSMRVNFANPADGGLLVSAKLNPPLQQQTPATFRQDKPLTDEERSRQSLAVFTGTVISCGFDKRVKSVDYYKATIRVQSIEKPDNLLSTNTVTLIYPTGTKIEPEQKVKCWCIHWDYDGKRVLYIPWPSSIKPQ
jgi:hypothetical protein